MALPVVLPMKGMAMGGGWSPQLLLTAFLVNGAWGVGTGLILAMLPKIVKEKRRIGSR